MIAQGKRKDTSDDEDSDGAMKTNRFSKSPGVEKAVGALVSLIVYNADRNPSLSMLPSPDDFRDLLWYHIDDDPKLSQLMAEDGYKAAFEEVRHIIYNGGRIELTSLMNMCLCQM